MNAIVVNVMLCAPMKGKTDEEIKASIETLKEQVSNHILQDFKGRNNIGEFMNDSTVTLKFWDNMVEYKNPTLDPERVIRQYRMFCLGNGISNVMPHCNYVVFGENWWESYGCIIEAITARSYGMNIVSINNGEIASDETFNRIIRDTINYKIENNWM